MTFGSGGTFSLPGGGGGGGGGGGASSAATRLAFAFFHSDVESSTLADGQRFIPLPPTVERFVQWELRAPSTETLAVHLGVAMSAAHGGGVRLRLDVAAIADDADPAAAAVVGTPFTFTPGNDALRHTSSTMTIAATAGTRYRCRLVRVAADAEDTHTGDLRIFDVSMGTA